MNVEHATAERTCRALERIAGILRAGAAAVVCGMAIWLFGDVLLLIFAAALLALGLRGAAGWISYAMGIPIGAALAVEVLAVIASLGVAGWWAGPRFVTEAGQLQDQLVLQWATTRDWLQSTSWGPPLLSHLPAGLGGADGEASLSRHLAGTIAGAVSSALGVLGTVVLVLASALYFAFSPRPYVEGPLRLVPHRARARTREILGQVGQTLQYWLAGQFLDMLVVGVVTGAGLALLGVPLAFVLGVVAGLLNFIPYIGAIAGAVPAILIALAQGPQQAAYVAVLFVVVQGLEGNVLSPLIQRRAVDLPPAATILAQTAFGALFGLPGIVLATPIAAAILMALRELTAEPEHHPL
jgi:predicted PurR-regulated permease PerM